MISADDTTLLLRVHAEHQWLQDELISLLDQLEQSAPLQTEELQAAIAYLEAMWAEELRRASQTDAAYQRLERREAYEGEPGPTVRQAKGYYGWLRSLRESLAARVEPLVGDDSPALLGI
jgi:hypothetical protein